MDIEPIRVSKDPLTRPSPPKTGERVRTGFADKLLDDDARYRALLARDPRFDGLFFVGVTTTGIYCRPVCTARTPGRRRVRFFSHAASAERAGFRPCLRCRPERAPGQAPLESVSQVAQRAIARIESGALRHGGSLETLARELGFSSRQLRRAVRREFGVSPIQWAQTCRMLLAKQLLAESQLPMIQVAQASGFHSVRRFNDQFQRHYGLTPSHLRRQHTAALARDYVRLTLDYRPPMAWKELLRFLAARATRGVEHVADGAYLRTASAGECRGWFRVQPMAGQHSLRVDVATSLVPELPQVLARIRHLFDLSARPDVISDVLRSDRLLAAVVRRIPGLRVPGSYDGLELAIRAILGQQITVAAATTLASRLAQSLGEPISTPFPQLIRVAPRAERLARVRTATLRGLGIRQAIARSCRDLASEHLNHPLCLEPGGAAQATIATLVSRPGIGPWTAHYIAMRALRWPDAFPHGDLGLLQATGLTSPHALHEMADAWRPWRAYAAMYLWESLATHRHRRRVSPQRTLSSSGGNPCRT